MVVNTSEGGVFYADGSGGTTLKQVAALPSHSHTTANITDFGTHVYDATVSRTKNTVLAAPNGSNGSATFRALVAADLPVVTATKGGSGETSLINSANAYLNALSIGSSNPSDADYYISQYAGGGTTTTTYHRRPVSALYNYIKGKLDNVYAAAGHIHSGTGLSDFLKWDGNTSFGIRQWSTTTTNKPTAYGTVFDFKDPGTTWYYRLAFSTSGDIRLYTGINTTTMALVGKLSYDGHTHNYAGSSTAGGAATNATNASNIYINNSSNNGAFPLTFVSNTTKGSQAVFVSTGKSLTFNPSTGNLAATTFTGSLSGNATTATSATTATTSSISNKLKCIDSRNTSILPNETTTGIVADFKAKAITGLTSTYSGVITFRSYGSASDLSGGPVYQIAMDLAGIHSRTSKDSSTWDVWRTILDSSNYSTYCAAKSHSHSYLPLTGGSLSGHLSSSDYLLGTGLIRVNAAGSTSNFGYIKAETYDSNRSVVHIGSNYGGSSSISNSVSYDAIGIYRTCVGIGGTFTGATLSSNYDAGIKLDINGSARGTNFITTSDERLKDFTSDISVDFDKLKTIPKKTYYWKDKEKYSSDLQIGTSAQALQKVYPECVNYDEANDVYSVDYQKLSIVALAAIDILNERISKLEEIILNSSK